MEEPAQSAPPNPDAIAPRFGLFIYAATTDPGIHDDRTAGYSYNSEWYNMSGVPTLWKCVDPSQGAAIWKQIGLFESFLFLGNIIGGGANHNGILYAGVAGELAVSPTIGAGQSIRRNAGDTAFEAFTPAAGFSTLPVTSGGTGTNTAFTPGSVVFAGASGVYNEDNGGLNYTSGVLSVPGNAQTFGPGWAGSDVVAIQDDIYTAFGGARASIKDFFTDAGNSGTSETDLYSYTIAAGKLANSGDKIFFDYALAFAGATSTKQIKLYLAGTNIFDTGAISIALGSFAQMSGWVIRVSSSVLRVFVSFETPGASTTLFDKYIELTGLTLSSTQIIKISGQAAGVGAASNDIVAKAGTISFAGAA